MPSFALSRLQSKSLAIAAKGRAMLAAALSTGAQMFNTNASRGSLPNGGRLQYAGHDHGLMGGLPLPRGVRLWVRPRQTDLTLMIDGRPKPTTPTTDSKATAPFCSNFRNPGISRAPRRGQTRNSKAKICPDVVSVSGTIDVSTTTTGSRSDVHNINSTGLRDQPLSLIPSSAARSMEFRSRSRATMPVELIVYSAVLAETRSRTQPQQQQRYTPECRQTMDDAPMAKVRIHPLRVARIARMEDQRDGHNRALDLRSDPICRGP